MYEVIRVIDDEEKAKITNLILRSLPEWFGIEEAIVEYTAGSKSYDFYAAYHEGKPIGFAGIKSNNKYTSEIDVMGVLREYHGKGIGGQLLEVAQEHLLKNSVKFLMVKTLGDSHPDKGYALTRKFYRKMGFYPLEEIKEIWGEKCPCLIMAKQL